MSLHLHETNKTAEALCLSCSNGGAAATAAAATGAATAAAAAALCYPLRLIGELNAVGKG